MTKEERKEDGVRIGNCAGKAAELTVWYFEQLMKKTGTVVSGPMRDEFMEMRSLPIETVNRLLDRINALEDEVEELKKIKS